MLGDVGSWLLGGIAIAALIGVFVPEDFFIRYLGNETLSLFIMLIIGIPIYICASASTPVVAALILKGLSPGAALVFLLAGPATNAATITVVTRYFGHKATAVYVLTISACSLVLGWLTNLLYQGLDLDILSWVESGTAESASSWASVAAIALLLLICRRFLPNRKGCCGS